MDDLVARLRADFPAFTFKEDTVAHWSPAESSIFYTSQEKTSSWTILHELGHALRGHTDYHSDVHLLRKESEAWATAMDLAKGYGVSIEARYIQDCLDTYRDWLHKRSTCPDCSGHGLQQNKGLYRCPNCQTQWQVTSARFCRPYRLKIAQNEK